MQNNMRVISKIILPFIAITLTTVMIKLGFWQLDRAEFKAQKQLIIDARVSQATRQLPADVVEKDEWQYFKVNVSGEFRPDLEFIVDNVVNKSIAGVNVVTPLKIAGSQTLILVNRGWLAWGNDRTFLPSIDTPLGSVKLTGILVQAVEDPFYLKDPEDFGEHKQLWSQLDLQRFKKLTDNPVQPLILLLDEDQPGSFEHIWQFQGDTWIARHKAYAFQWFGLAFALIVIILVLVYKYLIKKEKT